jgi:alkanesulfonate monooxygenase SsuD/methylene tetrahydromethanopterin reductase-like flavin-dependent oxidoreductase (luciferase family)
VHYGIELVPLGDHANPRNLIPLAKAAEAAGWESIFVWDHLNWGSWPVPAGDPWVMLSAVAASTEHIRLGTNVSPLPRYKLHVWGRTLATLDLLSQGRLILGVGLGAVHEEYTSFGEPGDYKTRAAMVDGGLPLLDRLMAGETVTHKGEYYTMKDVTMRPQPVQQPRVPFWIGGESKPALRRAAQWDGWVMGSIDKNCEVTKTPDELAEQVAYLREYRTTDAPFDIAIAGATGGPEDDQPQAYAAAGATWWLESIFGLRGSDEVLMARIEAGPPR